MAMAISTAKRTIVCGFEEDNDRWCTWRIKYLPLQSLLYCSLELQGSFLDCDVSGLASYKLLSCNRYEGHIFPPPPLLILFWRYSGSIDNHVRVLCSYKRWAFEKKLVFGESRFGIYKTFPLPPPPNQKRKIHLFET